MTTEVLTAIADKFGAAYNFGSTEGPMGVLSSAVNLVGIEVINLDFEGAPAITRPFGLPGLQTDTQAVPPAVSVGVTFGTIFRGKSFRGRTYIMGCPEDDITTDGYLIGNPLIAWQERWENWLGRVNGPSNVAGKLVIASYFHNKAPRAIGNMTDVASVRVNSAVRTQRRRQHA